MTKESHLRVSGEFISDLLAETAAGDGWEV
jgi:hypothetical protein